MIFADMIGTGTYSVTLIYLFNTGNERFRRLVADCLQEYSDSSTKLEKSYILCAIVAQVRANSPDGGFVKKDHKDGRWYEVGDFLAREKTSQAFRDALYDQYKSSNTAKKMRRLQDQDFKHPRRAFSSTALLDSKRRTGTHDGMEDLLMAKLRGDEANTHAAVQHRGDASAKALNQSCPNFGQDMKLNGSFSSLRNYDWKPSMKGGGAESFTDPLLGRLLNHQRSARSVLEFANAHGTAFINQSASNFGQDLNASIHSLQNYEWDTRPGIRSLSDENNSDSTDLHYHYSADKLEAMPDSFSRNHNVNLALSILSQTEQSRVQPEGANSSIEERLIALRRATLASGGFDADRSGHQPPTVDVFDRLAKLVGDVPQEGDPFEPKPVDRTASGGRAVIEEG